MVVSIGFVVVIVSVVGGFLLEKGNLYVLFQPAEFLIIGGAAVGSFIIASPKKVIKGVLEHTKRIFKKTSYDKNDYLEALLFLNGVFYKIRKQGLVAIESDVDNPAGSPLFNRYSSIMGNERVLHLVSDTLRMVMSTTIAPHELESLIDSEIESHYEELILPSKSVNSVADSLPGLGIVAAVLGVVLTMGKMGEPPEVLGHSIGAALVGTFLGVLLCYGFVGPVGRHMEHIAREEIRFLTVFKVALLAFVQGAAPKVALEFGRRVIPKEVKPTFTEVEELLRKSK